MSYLCNRNRETTVAKEKGSLDEWLSQRSAKPCTAVRIRQEPRRKASKLFVMNASRLFLFCPSVTLAGLSGGSRKLFIWRISYLRLTELHKIL